MEMDRKSRLSKDEAYLLIEQYYQSGELPSVFYRRVGLSDKQFYAWRQRYLRDHPSLAKKLGVDLTVKTPRNVSYKLPLNTTPPTSASDWVQSAAELLEPLYLKLRERVMSSDYIQMDESIIPVLDKDKPGSAKKGYHWVVRSPELKSLFFHYDKGSR